MPFIAWDVVSAQKMEYFKSNKRFSVEIEKDCVPFKRLSIVTNCGIINYNF